MSMGKKRLAAGSSTQEYVVFSPPRINLTSTNIGYEYEVFPKKRSDISHVPFDVPPAGRQLWGHTFRTRDSWSRHPLYAYVAGGSTYLFAMKLAETGYAHVAHHRLISHPSRTGPIVVCVVSYEMADVRLRYPAFSFYTCPSPTQSGVAPFRRGIGGLAAAGAPIGRGPLTRISHLWAGNIRTRQKRATTPHTAGKTDTSWMMKAGPTPSRARSFVLYLGGRGTSRRCATTRVMLSMAHRRLGMAAQLPCADVTYSSISHFSCSTPLPSKKYIKRKLRVPGVVSRCTGESTLRDTTVACL